MKDGLQIKISLLRSKPLIWRRVVVNSDITLEELHQTIQIVMQWEGHHLHSFEQRGKYYSPANAVEEWEEQDEVENYNTTTVGDLLQATGDKLNYTYDFGDDWEHRLELEKIVDPLDGLKAKYITGRSCSPIEDCGGIWGYYDLVDALNNPDNPNHEEMREWLELEAGDVFDLKYIELTPAEFNEMLSSI